MYCVPVFLVVKINFKHYSDLSFLKMECDVSGLWDGLGAQKSIKEVLLFPGPKDTRYNIIKIIKVM